MSNCFNIVFTIIATFVGAGFASGKEIYLYFFSYGKIGIIGILLSSIFIGVVIYKSILIMLNNKINNYNDFLDIIIKNKNMRKFFNYLINYFLLFSFCIMINGFCSLLRQEFNINIYISFFYIFFICLFCYLKKINTFVKINSFLIPIIIFSIIYILFININNIKFENIIIYKNNNILDNFFSSFIIYANYNLLSIIPVLPVISRYINNKRNVKKYILFFGIIIFILSISIFYILQSGDIILWNQDMPLISIVNKFNNKYLLFYFFIILFSIITTAISLAYSYMNKFENNKKYKYIFLLFFISIILLNFSFTKLIKVLYPIYGCIGLIQSCYIIKR